MFGFWADEQNDVQTVERWTIRETIVCDVFGEVSIIFFLGHARNIRQQYIGVSKLWAPWECWKKLCPLVIHRLKRKTRKVDLKNGLVRACDGKMLNVGNSRIVMRLTVLLDQLSTVNLLIMLCFNCQIKMDLMCVDPRWRKPQWMIDLVSPLGGPMNWTVQGKPGHFYVGIETKIYLNLVGWGLHRKRITFLKLDITFRWSHKGICRWKWLARDVDCG